MRSKLEKSLFGSCLCLLSACAGQFKSTVNFNPSEPIRIAVLPFAQVNDKGELVRTDENIVIDNVPLVSSKLEDTPARFVQNLVQSELGKTSLDVITPGVVEAELLHNGFYAAGSNPAQVNLPKLFAANPKEICDKLLSCDAVLYGKITRWTRTYYGIQSTSTVGINLKLVSASDGKVLFESTAEDSDGRGLSKGPTGFSNLVIEPLKGLDNEIIQNLARDVVEKMTTPLVMTNRPEFLQSAPPAILASAHDALNGTISHKGQLTVVALGTAGQKATFSIGDKIENIPMVEHDPGHYVGEYYPLASDAFASQPVTVSLRDQFGRQVTQKLGRGNVSLQ